MVKGTNCCTKQHLKKRKKKICYKVLKKQLAAGVKKKQIVLTLTP